MIAIVAIVPQMRTKFKISLKLLTVPNKENRQDGFSCVSIEVPAFTVLIQNSRVFGDKFLKIKLLR